MDYGYGNDDGVNSYTNSDPLAYSDYSAMPDLPSAYGDIGTFEPGSSDWLNNFDFGEASSGLYGNDNLSSYIQQAIDPSISYNNSVLGFLANPDLRQYGTVDLNELSSGAPFLNDVPSDMASYVREIARPTYSSNDFKVQDALTEGRVNDTGGGTYMLDGKTLDSIGLEQELARAKYSDTGKPPVWSKNPDTTWKLGDVSPYQNPQMSAINSNMNDKFAAMSYGQSMADYNPETNTYENARAVHGPYSAMYDWQNDPTGEKTFNQVEGQAAEGQGLVSPNTSWLSKLTAALTGKNPGQGNESRSGSSSSAAQQARGAAGGASNGQGGPMGALNMAAVLASLLGGGDKKGPKSSQGDINSNAWSVERMKTRGKPQNKASGGKIQGRGQSQGALGLLAGDRPGQHDGVPINAAHGEYVMDADIVSALGDGNTEAGAAKLDGMREQIRKHKRSAPNNKIPPKAKAPLAYMKGAK
jgi:hypothetical protein